MIRVPEWAFEAAGQEMRGIGQDTAAYHPGLYLTAAQVSPTSPRIRTEFSLYFGVVLVIFVSFCIQVSHFRSIVAIYLIIIIIILICFGFWWLGIFFVIRREKLWRHSFRNFQSLG